MNLVSQIHKELVFLGPEEGTRRFAEQELLVQTTSRFTHGLGLEQVVQ